MFKNREFRVRVAKTDDENANQAEPQTKYTFADAMRDIDPVEVLGATAICVVGVILSVGLSNALEKSIVHVVTTKIK